MEKEKKDAASPEEVAGVTTENMEDLTGMSAGAALESAAPEGDEDAETVPGGPETEAAAADWAREKEELVSLVQRKQADLDNFRRISRMKEEEIRTYGLFNFLEKLLPVLDNMERALVTAREDEGVPESHLKGLLMIRKQLLQLLEQEGVEPVKALGEVFDPHFHEAVLQIPGGRGEPGSVIEEIQKGYLYKERVLRPSRVAVKQQK